MLSFDIFTEMKTPLKVNFESNHLDLIYTNGKEFNPGGYDILEVKEIKNEKNKRIRYALKVEMDGFIQYILIDYSTDNKMYSIMLPAMVEGRFISYMTFM